MTFQWDAAWRLHRFLAARGVEYAIIGGIAVQKWGQPRFTSDLDVTVCVPPGRETHLIGELLKTFPPRRRDAASFAREHRVLLITLPGLCDADISFGLPGYEGCMMERAVDCNIGRRRKVRICSPEDLIIHKAVAGRGRDIEDVEGIVDRQGRKLDVRYIRKWLREFARALEIPDVLKRFERPWIAFQRRHKSTRRGGSRAR